MPYIRKERRKELLGGKEPETCRDLNFLFTTIIHSYIKKKGESYQNYNDAVGALENCKLELYRRKIGKYEDLKIKENGDLE